MVIKAVTQDQVTKVRSVERNPRTENWGILTFKSQGVEEELRGTAGIIMRQEEN